MASSDRRRHVVQTPLHKVATPPAPLLFMPASKGLTFSSDDVHMTPGLFMPVALPAPPESSVEIDSFLGQDLNLNSTAQAVENSGQQFTVPTFDQSVPQNNYFVPEHGNCFSPNAQHTDCDLNNAQIVMVPTIDVNESSIPLQSQITAEQNIFVPQLNMVDALVAPVANADPLNSTGIAAVAAAGPCKPVQFHWFYCKNVELRQIWQAFSQLDSDNMEAVYQALTFDNIQEHGYTSSTNIVSVNGGRYDVDINKRLRRAVYWDEPESHVRRCSWFYRTDADSRIIPYEEEFASRLEESYRSVAISGSWHQKIDYPEGDVIIIHSPTVIMHFSAPSPGYSWASPMGESCPPRAVKRGSEDFDNIPYVMLNASDESVQVDHLVFVVHGIGPGCDMRFRNIVECVDDFRAVSYQMLVSHFREHQDSGRIGRVEFLPVRWHSALHGDATGVDRKLKAITLPSIGRLRQFTNDTLLDVLFYGSPAYAQQIADTIGCEMNGLYELFCQRNQSFCGAVSVAGHSLGSLILFDLLVHQNAECDADTSSSNESLLCQQVTEHPLGTTSSSDIRTIENEDNAVSGDEVLTIENLLSRLGLGEYQGLFEREQIDIDTLIICEANDLKEMGLPLGPRKKLLSFLENKKQSKSAIDISPLMPSSRESDVSTVVSGQSAAPSGDISHSRHDPFLRSASSTSVNFIVGAGGTGVPWVRYPQLKFKPCAFFALGSPIAMFLTVRGTDSLGDKFRLPTCPGFFNIFHPFDPVAYRIEPMILSGCPVKPVLIPHHKGRKRLHLELRESLTRVGTDIKQKIIESVKSTWRTINDLAHYRRTAAGDESIADTSGDGDDSLYEDTLSSSMLSGPLDEEYPIGQLNSGHRVDYVLQEKPIESFNDYLFALSSHACYWESEDTALMILKQLYSLIDVASERTVDLLPGNQTVATFPRHPLASGSTSQNILSPRDHQHTFSDSSQSVMGGSNLPVSGVSNQSMMGVCHQTVMDVGPHLSSELPSLPQPASFNNIGYDQMPVFSTPAAVPAAATLPLNMGAQVNVGPPPKSGFVRK